MDTAAAVESVNSAQAYQDDGGVPGVDAIQVRYNEERTKRLRPEGGSQYIDLSLSDKFSTFLEDPWADESRVQELSAQFPDGKCGFLILGAGFTGLLYAIHMIKAGYNPTDIRIVDTASGFGGTWYWNRFPGLMCDVESYCYLPLLEETGYIPRHRFSYGEEIREYAELLAQKWGITDCAVWKTKAEKFVWDEEKKEWQVSLVQRRQGKKPENLNVRCSLVAMVNAPLNWPRLPGFPGIEEFRGQVFHPSRWNYSITGGSPAEATMTKLQDKRVAIIGTGATAVQVVPQLARWAKHLYVVQRTPSAVDNRDQRVTDEDWFKQNVATGPGWQRERNRNLHEFMFSTKDHPSTNLVDDGFSHAHAMVALVGNPSGGPSSMDELPAYIRYLHSVDLPRQERIRKRCESVVKDQATAKKLQAWYPTWCKRPCFHDDYLPAFNRDNVTLVDTNAKGVDKLTSDSIVVGDQIYPVDVIVFATGYREPLGGTPAEKANVTIIGREGISMSEEWTKNGPSTLHGTLDRNFPNLFLPGLWQASLSPNNMFHCNISAQTAAYVIAEARKQAKGRPFAVSSTKEATDDWAKQIVQTSLPNAAAMGCTPSYFNGEGDVDKILGSAPPELLEVFAKSGTWGKGIESYVQVVEDWRIAGNMKGVEVHV